MPETLYVVSWAIARRPHRQPAEWELVWERRKWHWEWECGARRGVRRIKVSPGVGVGVRRAARRPTNTCFARPGGIAKRAQRQLAQWESAARSAACDE